MGLILTRRRPFAERVSLRTGRFSTGWADLFCVSLTQATPTDLVKQPLVAPLEALPLGSRRVRSPHDAVLVRDEEELVVAQLSVVKVIEEAPASLDRNA